MAGKKGWVYAQDKWGDKQYIHPDDVASAQAQGWQILTPFDEKVDDFVEQNKGLRGGAKVFLGQMGDEALGGIPELVYDKTADPMDVAKKEALKKYHAGWNAAGGITGFGAGMFIGGPAFKAAGKGGELATRGVAKMLGAKAAGEVGETTLKKIARDVVAKAAGTGVEGTILSSPYAFTEAVLGDPDDAAETILFGLGVGSIFGAGGAMAKGFKDLVTESRLGQAARDRIKKTIAENKDLQGKAHEKFVEALNPNLSQQERMRAMEEVFDDAGDVVSLKPTENLRAIGKDLEEEGIIDMFDFKSDIYDKLSKRTAELGEDVGKILQGFDDRFGEFAALRTEELVANIRARIDANDYFKTTAFKPFVERVNKQLDALLEQGPILSMRQANREKSAFQQLAKAAYQSANAGIDVNTAQVLAEIPREINKAIRSKAKELDPAALQELLLKQRKLAHLSQAEEIAKKSAAREARNNDFGLTSFIGGAGAMTTGAVLGGAPGAVVMGLAGMLGREFSRRFGDQVMAHAYSRAGSLLFTEQAMKKAADKLDDIPSLLGRLKKRTPKTRTMGLEALNRMFRPDNASLIELEERSDRDKPIKAPKKVEALDRASRALGTWVANPDRAAQRIAEITTPIASEGAPMIAQALSAKLNVGISYLYEQIPKPPAPNNPFAPRYKWKPSDYEMDAFLDKAAVVENPFVVLDELESGTLNRNHMQALKNVYPGMHAYMQDRVQKAAINETIELTYDQRLKLSLLMDAPMDSSLNNNSIQYFQQTHQLSAGQNVGDAAGPQKGQQPFKASVDLAGGMMTEQQAMESRRA